MKQENNRPRFHRRAFSSPRGVNGIWTAALITLFFASSGVALADHRHGDRDDRNRRQESGRYDKYDDHSGSRGNHRHERHNWHRQEHDRYDHHRGNHDRRHYGNHRHDRYQHDYRHDRYRHDRYRHDRYRPGHGGYYRHRFDIPRAITHELLHAYSSYHHGRQYYARHRHNHEIYRFPVYGEYGVDYYPYAYCEGNFFGRGTFRNGRVKFGINISF